MADGSMGDTRNSPIPHLLTSTPCEGVYLMTVNARSILVTWEASTLEQATSTASSKRWSVERSTAWRDWGEGGKGVSESVSEWVG